MPLVQLFPSLNGLDQLLAKLAWVIHYFSTNRRFSLLNFWIATGTKQTVLLVIPRTHFGLAVLVTLSALVLLNLWVFSMNWIFSRIEMDKVVGFLSSGSWRLLHFSWTFWIFKLTGTSMMIRTCSWHLSRYFWLRPYRLQLELRLVFFASASGLHSWSIFFLLFIADSILLSQYIGSPDLPQYAHLFLPSLHLKTVLIKLFFIIWRMLIILQKILKGQRQDIFRIDLHLSKNPFSDRW